MESKFLKKITVLSLGLSFLFSCGTESSPVLKRANLLTLKGDDGSLSLVNLKGKTLLEGCSSLYWNEKEEVTYSKDSKAYSLIGGKSSLVEGYTKLTPSNGSFSLGIDASGNLSILDSSFSPIGSKQYSKCLNFTKNRALLLDEAGDYYAVNGSDSGKIDGSLQYSVSFAGPNGSSYYAFLDSSKKTCLFSYKGIRNVSHSYDTVKYIALEGIPYAIASSEEGTDAYPASDDGPIHLSDHAVFFASNAESGLVFYDADNIIAFDTGLKEAFSYPIAEAAALASTSVYKDGKLYLINAPKSGLNVVDSSLKVTDLLAGSLVAPVLYSDYDFIFDANKGTAYHFDGKPYQGAFSNLRILDFGQKHLFVDGELLYSPDFSATVSLGFAPSSHSSSYGGTALLLDQKSMAFSFFDLSAHQTIKTVRLSEKFFSSPWISRDLALVPNGEVSTGKGDIYYKDGSKVASDTYIYYSSANDFVFGDDFLIKSF